MEQETNRKPRRLAEEQKDWMAVRLDRVAEKRIRSRSLDSVDEEKLVAAFAWSKTSEQTQT